MTRQEILDQLPKHLKDYINSLDPSTCKLSDMTPPVRAMQEDPKLAKLIEQFDDFEK